MRFAIAEHRLVIGFRLVSGEHSSCARASHSTDVADIVKSPLNSIVFVRFLLLALSRWPRTRPVAVTDNCAIIPDRQHAL